MTITTAELSIRGGVSMSGPEADGRGRWLRSRSSVRSARRTAQGVGTMAKASGGLCKRSSEQAPRTLTDDRPLALGHLCRELLAEHKSHPWVGRDASAPCQPGGRTPVLEP